MGVTRTVTLNDLTPEEMANIFAMYYAEQQAAFFDALAVEVRAWGGLSRLQWVEVTPRLSDDGRRVYQEMADAL